MIETPSHTSQQPSFRDRLTTLDAQGKRKWIYAKKPTGRFYKWRTWASLVYFTLFFSVPFVQVNGRPLFLFNIPQARFILFGKVFWPQDFFIFGLGMVAFIFFIILFTAAYGRLFCGWACPQTNFMEMMFRRVEYWIEGDAAAQRMLNNGPWTAGKMFKKALKHTVFFAMAFVIANFFLSYIIGMPALTSIITQPVAAHIGGFSSILIFSGVFYGVYAFFREQVCTAVCPYGRLQGVLLDKNSLVVAYDYRRGEPRGNPKKAASLPLGDCIDCSACVRVCPTGIDIRNGVQLECVACTACIDACDAIMDKVGKPRGLIRYATENTIESGKPFSLTNRLKMYMGLCGAIVVVLAVMLATRSDMAITVMRTPGMLYQEHGPDSISNLYNIKLANKTNRRLPVTIRLHQGGGRVLMAGKQWVDVAAEGQGSGSFFVILPRQAVTQRKTEIKLEVLENNKHLKTVQTNFLSATTR